MASVRQPRVPSIPSYADHTFASNRRIRRRGTSNKQRATSRLNIYKAQVSRVNRRGPYNARRVKRGF